MGLPKTILFIIFFVYSSCLCEKKVVCITGPSCSGKSTISREIRNITGVAIVSTDEVLNDVFKLVTGEFRIPDKYREFIDSVSRENMGIFFNRLKDEIITRINLCLGQGDTVILEGIVNYDWIKVLERHFNPQGVRFFSVLAFCPLGSVIGRIEARSEVKPACIEEVLEQFRTFYKVCLYETESSIGIITAEDVDDIYCHLVSRGKPSDICLELIRKFGLNDKNFSYVVLRHNDINLVVDTSLVNPKEIAENLVSFYDIPRLTV